MPDTIAQYLLLERIGTGALGEVYRARDTRHGRTVAVKLLPLDFLQDADTRARFFEDARAATALSHPAIAALFEIGEAGGRVFLASEYVPGSSLRALLAGGPVHPKRAVPMAIQLADALAAAHSIGILHRDLGPDTIVVTPKGSAKVLDLGLASWTSGGRARSDAARDALDPVRALRTIPYMSPEQALAQPLDSRTDVFSLGVVLYEMLTGRNPFASDRLDATLVNILKVSPPAPSQVNRVVPEELDRIVLRMVARDVQTRYPSADQVASELRAAYAERTEHVFEDDVPSRPARAGRRWWPAAVALLVVVGMSLGGYSQRAEVRRVWKRWFGAPLPPVIVVASFEATDRQHAEFAIAFGDDLAMRLGHTPGLRVVGRSPGGAHRGRPPAALARAADARVALTGSIDRALTELTIDVTLVDPADGIQVWHQRFVTPAANVLAAQVLIADDVARVLRVPPVPTELRERSMARIVSPEAYDAYLQGRLAFERGDHESAIHRFEEAVRLDTGLAEAFAGLAESVFARAAGRNGLDDVQYPRVRQFAAKAAAIEPDLAPVRIASGLGAGSYRDALRHLVRAAVRDPSSAQALRHIADQLIHVDTPRAVRLYERARALDRQMPAAYSGLALAKAALGKREEATQEAAASSRMHPADASGILLQAVLGGRSGASAPSLSKARELANGLPPGGIVWLWQTLASSGRPDHAVQLMDAMPEVAREVCEGRAVRAGLSRLDARSSDGRAAAGSFVSSPPRCAAVAAAALRDLEAVTEQLQIIARDEFALRSWMQVRADGTGELAFVSRAYPWAGVAGTPRIDSAHGAVLAAMRGLKQIADEELKSLP